MRRAAAPVAILTAVIVFVAFFVLLAGADLALRLGAPVVLAAVAASGTYLMLARSAAQISDDAYHDDARAKAREVEQTIARAVDASRKVRNPVVRASIARAGEVIPELLDRLAASQPSSLYSSAARLAGHARSLQGLVEQYADIEAHPSYYHDAPALLAEGERAIERFDAFALESIRLVNQGEMATYQANLDTVAPPEIPRLEG